MILEQNLKFDFNKNPRKKDQLLNFQHLKYKFKQLFYDNAHHIIIRNNNAYWSDCPPNVEEWNLQQEATLAADFLGVPQND